MPSRLRIPVCRNLFFLSSGASGRSCTLCDLSKHKWHELDLYGDVYTLHMCVDGSIEDKEVIHNQRSVSIKFEDTPDPCPIDVVPVPNDVITITD